MPTIARLIQTLRPAILVVLGAVIGAGVAPVMAGAHPDAQIASTQTRSASCSGLNFHPIDSTIGYTNDGLELYMTDGGSANAGFFVCDPNLPNGAVVKQVQFTVLDSDDGEARYCGLFRSSLVASSAGTYQTVAQLPSSNTHTAGGVARLSTNSISHATVDNAKYAYWLQCQLTDDSHWLGIYGADVIYTISSSNG